MHSANLHLLIKRINAALLSIAALLLISSDSYAQNWRVYSPHDKSFSVELPAPLSKVKSFDGEHGVDYSPDWDRHGISSYAAIETNQDDCRFGIVVVGRKIRARYLRLGARDEIIQYLSVLFIGDDDDATPDIKREVHANGLRGREYFYIRDDTGSTGEIHTRGRIFDTGNKLYVVIFVGRKTDDLTSADAERFFSSFRLRNQRTKVEKSRS